MRTIRSAHRATMALATLAVAAAAGTVGGAGAVAAASCNQQGCVQLSGSMEGSLSIRPGDWISAGYQFSLPGNNGKKLSTIVGFDQAAVVLPVTCSGGGGGSIVIGLGNPADPYASDPYHVPANFAKWAPTSLLGDGSTVNGSQQSYGSFEGALQAPDLCHGVPMRDTAASLSVPTVQWSVAPVAAISVQFHYRDPNAMGHGNVDCASPTDNPGTGNAAVCGASWSGTAAVTPTLNGDPVPMTGVAGPGVFVVVAGGALIALQLRRRHRRPSGVA